MPSFTTPIYHEDVEFKTIDGLTLRGWLYPAASKGPAVIMTPGVSKMQYLVNDLTFATVQLCEGDATS